MGSYPCPRLPVAIDWPPLKQKADFMDNFLLEAFGYLGSVLVAVSLMMSNIKMLRWINLVGAAIFAIYGGLIGAVPVAVLNGFIAVVDVYYLIRIYQFADRFDLIDTKQAESSIVQLLIDSHRGDFECYFPQYDEDRTTGYSALILRNLTPAGFFACGAPDEQGTAELLVDYVTPDVRDYKNGRYFYSKQTTKLKSKGINKLVSFNSNADHQAYLAKVGFQKVGNQYELNL